MVFAPMSLPSQKKGTVKKSGVVLLQYPEGQEVFFDPSYLKSQEAAESPNVAELLAVLDGILSEQQNNRTNGTATQNNTHFSSTK